MNDKHLPQPDEDAHAHSIRLQARIVAEARERGWLSFARYMELALYEPGLGYYSGGAKKFGAAGDFVTAPEMSPLFAQTLARQLVQIMAQSAPAVMEIGAGSGALAVELLLELARLDSAPESYGILELSAELEQRQRRLLQGRAPQLLHRVHWHKQLPESFTGVVVANELLDAMPVQLVHWQTDGSIRERGVVAGDGDTLEWSDGPAPKALLSAAETISVPTPYLSEVGLAAGAWIVEWAHILEKGALLLIDYGFPRHEYYHPQRDSGTLMCHYRHRAHTDPFYLPGLGDISAHVDFTAVAEAAASGGLDILGYTSQASFLMNCGIGELLAAQDPTDTARYLPVASAANKLLSPAEMGELFKVMLIGRGLDEPMLGFVRGDRCHTL